jgi:60 kDa SS-A/Ro ribonucleoprotein
MMRFLFGGFAAQRAPQPERQAVDRRVALECFLSTGAGDGTYPPAGSSPDRPEFIAACLEEDGRRVVEMVLSRLESGVAASSEAGLLALAMAASPEYAGRATNALAFAALPLAARTSSELARFVELAREFRGWGRKLRNAVARWYLEKPARELAAQMLKSRHQQDLRWTHRDLIRMAHPKPDSAAHQALFRWAVEDELDVRTHPALLEGDLRQVHGYELLRDTTDEARAAWLVEEYRLAPDMIPPEWKGSPRVWEALLPSLSYGALLRNLGRLTALGLLEPGREAGALVVARLLDRGRIRRGQVQPMTVWRALDAYRTGGAGWQASAGVLDALETVFCAALDNAAGTIRQCRLYVALDASEEMSRHRELAAALALVLARATEEEVYSKAFDDGAVWGLEVNARDRLSAVADRLPCSRAASDGALPVFDALARRLEVDAFVLITAEDRWYGSADPAGALGAYREGIGWPVRLAVVALGADRARSRGREHLSIAGWDAGAMPVLTSFLNRGMAWRRT